MIHGTQELQVVDGLEDTTGVLIQEVEALLVNKLTSDFKSNLITPSVHERHGQIIKEEGHLLVVWWNVNLGLLTLNFSFNRILEVSWLSSTGEVDTFEQHNT
jgi:hypothetical protein